MDLEEVYELALKADHVIRKAHVIHAGSREVVKQSEAKFWPQISTRTWYTKNLQDRAVHGYNNASLLYSKPEYASSGYNISITQSLFNYGTIINNKQAWAKHKLADIEHNEISRHLILRVITAYIGVLAANEEIRYRELEQKAVRKQLKLTEYRRKLRISVQFDVNEAKARYDQAMANQATANIRLSIANEALREIIGKKHDHLEPFNETAPSNMPDPNKLSFWIMQAQANNYRLLVAQQQLKIAYIGINKQQSSRYPNLSLIASYDYYNDLELDYVGAELETGSLTARLDWNFYKGGRISSKIRQAELYKDQLNISLQQQQSLVERQIRDAFYILVGGVTHINKLKQSIKSQKVVLKANKAGYKAGKKPNLDVLNARTNLYNLRRELAQARHDHVLHHAILKYNSGVISKDDIEHLNLYLN